MSFAGCYLRRLRGLASRRLGKQTVQLLLKLKPQMQPASFLVVFSFFLLRACRAEPFSDCFDVLKPKGDDPAAPR